MRLNALISGLIIMIIVGAVIFFILSNNVSSLTITISLIISVIIFLNVLLNIILYPKIRYQRYKYLVTDEKIEVKKGLFIITKSIIQIKRIQKIELSNGPIDRHYHLSNVNIYTAAGVVDIKFLNNKEAEAIADRVNTLLKYNLEQNHEN